jgi:hypothetical protein
MSDAVGPLRLSTNVGPHDAMKTIPKMPMFLGLALLLALWGCGLHSERTGNQSAPASNVVTTPSTTVPRATIAEVLAHKEDYQGKRIEVVGYYMSWFEGSVLRDNSNSAPAVSLWIDRFRLKGDTNTIQWVESGFIRVTGRFKYNEEHRSGHLGMCPAEISEVESFKAIP